jgi:hypothetical protein
VARKDEKVLFELRLHRHSRNATSDMLTFASTSPYVIFVLCPRLRVSSTPRVHKAIAPTVWLFLSRQSCHPDPSPRPAIVDPKLSATLAALGPRQITSQIPVPVAGRGEGATG